MFVTVLLSVQEVRTVVENVRAIVADSDGANEPIEHWTMPLVTEQATPVLVDVNEE